MRAYTLHEPPTVPWTSVASRAETFELVREGYSVLAAILGPLWLVWNRLWLEAAGFVGVLAAGYGLLWLFGANEDAVGVWPLMVGIGLGFLANDLRRSAFARAGFAERGTVSGDSLRACELQVMSDLLAAAPRASVATA